MAIGPKDSPGQDLVVKQANGTEGRLLDLSPEADLWTLLNIPTNNALDLLHEYSKVVGGDDKALLAIRPYGPQVCSHFQNTINVKINP
jgi:hypothetical protein